MPFNPLKEKGMPLEKQFRSWSELTAVQYKKERVHPYTRCRIIAMNGIEVDAAVFKHQMARMTVDPELKRALALSRRVEQQQQKAIAGMVPGDETTLEHTIGYEQVAVDLTAWCARNEPDAYARQAYEFGLLEDFDHLYRYANMLDMVGGMPPEDIVGELTEIMPGRPTVSEHRHPFDSIRKPVDAATADPVTLMNIMTLIAAEQQTMNFYMNVANRAEETLLRGLYTEIGMIEEQHVSHYESLMDPRCSWLMCAVLHELHECWLYNSFLEQEKDAKAKKIWELHLDMEIGHLHNALQLYRKFERKDPEEFLPAKMPPGLVFESNVEYVREVLESQMELTADGTEFVPIGDLPEDHRYYDYQGMVNKGKIPSEAVIKQRVKEEGADYRFETDEHSVDRFRNRKKIPVY